MPLLVTALKPPPAHLPAIPAALAPCRSTNGARWTACVVAGASTEKAHWTVLQLRRRRTPECLLQPITRPGDFESAPRKLPLAPPRRTTSEDRPDIARRAGYNCREEHRQRGIVRSKG